MAYDDIDIPLHSMQELETALTNIIAEFEGTGGRSESLESAIGSPLGRSELRSEAQRFEEAWNDKRDTLRDHLADLKTRTTETKNAWQDLDRELATASEVSDGNDGK